jgi:peptide/nickel transport system substrate-binding protein
MTTKRIFLLLMVILVVGLTACQRAEKTTEEKIADIIKRGRYGEAPMLATMVKAGELPSVKDRLPEEPVVVEPIEGIGRYGGELIVYATGENIFGQDFQGMWGTSFFRQPRSGVWIEPDVAEGWEINEDKTAITVFMRPGMKWSDGAPLTSEDVRFTFEDMHFNENVGTWGSYGIDAVEVIDEYTIKLINNEGLGTNPLQMSTWFGGYATSMHPAHYLKKWHLDYNSEAEKLAKDAGFDNWYSYMRDHYWWAPLKDPDKPQIEPWQLVQFTSTGKLFERNPYFHRVDQEGNQLPYIDRMRIQIVDGEVYQLKVSSGAASIAYAQATLENLPLYKQGEAAGDYRTILHPGTMVSLWL